MSAEIDHARGLCGEPDIPNNTPREDIESGRVIPKCQCCGATMQIRDCTSIGMQQLGMYALICPECPFQRW